ncbi:MAG: glycosyltransferase family 2 protein [Chloroflexota bacterium]
MTRPFVSVVVLNYNGLRFLDGCLGSLARLDYPADRYEVVIVDNVSSDGSAEVAEKRFPKFRVVRNDRNLGFAAGNNVAMRATQADYVALLNNDTAVDEQWLSGLVDAAESDPAVGACTSKLLFLHDRARVRMDATPFRPSEWGSSDQRELGVKLLAARVVQGGDSRDVEYLEGFFGLEPSSEGPFRWSQSDATLGLRVSSSDGPASLQLISAAPRPDGEQVRLSLFSRDCLLGSWEVGSQPQQIELSLPEELIETATPVIQNTGTLILRDGSGRDRGTIVRGTNVYQEDDLGQYGHREEVFGGCGAALLLKRAMLEDVGLFDEDFFMYYEDMDLSWRARRRGWKILYVPEAVVRHVHCGSSGEWSPLFLYHVERNRLLMLAKNAPLGLASSEQLRYAASALVNLGRYARSLALRSPDRAVVGRRLQIQLRVIGWLLSHTPSTVRKRWLLQRREVVPASRLMKWMVPA